MISYKYKLYKTTKTKHLDLMLSEACFLWNHALALQKRYYKIYKQYIRCSRMKSHFAKRIHRKLIHSQTAQEILERLDVSYQRFFNRIAKRPPKFHIDKSFTSIVFKQCGYSLNGNVLTINAINKRYKFSLSRKYEGIVKTLMLKRNRLGEYFVIITIDSQINSLEKTHNGASVGIDFGMKKYLTLSDGTSYDNPQFLKKSLTELRCRCRNFSKCKDGSKKEELKRKELNRLTTYIYNKRKDFQWKLAHELCRKYDKIFIEDLNIEDLCLKWGRKIQDLGHGDFVIILEYVAKKYGVVVHKINRYYPSSKTCTCGYVHNGLKLADRKWICPVCGTEHKRDLLAANNILRRGIYELDSDYKTSKQPAKRLSCLNPRIHV